MNNLKPISTLLLIATMVGVSAPHLHAEGTATGNQALVYLLATDPAAATAQAQELSHSKKYPFRTALVGQQHIEANRLFWHSVHPKDLLTLQSEISTTMHKTERWRSIGLTSAGALLTAITAFKTRKGVKASKGKQAGSYFILTYILGAFSVVSLANLIHNESGDLTKIFPKGDVSSLSFQHLRDLRLMIAKQLTQTFTGNNRFFIQAAALGLTVEEAYNKKLMQIGAIGGAVALAAIVLFLAASAVRKNTKAAAATIGAGALGGLAGLLSLSPLATPVINERLKRLQTQYRASLGQVQQGK